MIVKRLLPILVAAVAGAIAAWMVMRSPPDVDRSQPPAIVQGAGGFTVRPLTAAPAVDGQTWIAIEPVYATGPVRAPNGAFTLTLEEAHSTDVVHYRVAFTEGTRAPVQLAPDGAVFASITPDSRWIFTGTLEAIDVTTWRRYGLSTAFEIPPYVVLHAISADGRRLLISQRDCAFDCPDIQARHYEIGFPPG